ncbi:MAG: radical SAM protein, partial [Deltaproteobacteria bacterium]|nr:radical SAM protein [Deltaproteobacteria bacterium]
MTGQPKPVTSRLAASFLPSTAVLEMTYACNHECLFCSCPWFAPDGRFARHEEMTVEWWKKTLAKLCAMGVTQLAFTGGEPLLKPGVAELIEFASTCTGEHVKTVDGALVVEHAPPFLHLLTNGMTLTEETLDLCARHKVHVGLSLPGLASFADH